MADPLGESSGSGAAKQFDAPVSHNQSDKVELHDAQQNGDLLSADDVPTALLELQTTDHLLDDLRRQREDLASKLALRQSLQAASLLELQIRTDQAELVAHKAAEVALVHRGETLRSRADGLSKRLYGPSAAGNRDLAAIDHELQATREQLSTVDDETITAMERTEVLEGICASELDELKSLQRTIFDLEHEVGESEKEIDAKALPHLKTRTKLLNSLPPDVSRRYEVLRKRMGGMAVAQVVDHSCTGCHLELAATELDRLRHAPPSALAACESCGRILVRVQD